MFLPVIISGGAGERLWPVSRSSFPKPFMAMPDGKSLLQKAFLRAQSLDDTQEILTITNKEYYFKTCDEYAAVKNKNIETSFLLEPIGRNTAPAIAMAAHYAEKIYGADTILLIFPADQLIEKNTEFVKAVAEARLLAEKNYLVAFGIAPNRPETGFGYIELPSINIENSPNGYVAERFVEKPDLATAESYIKNGKYVWNAGIFCFKAGVFLQELAQNSPEIASAISNVVKTTDFQQASHSYAELDEQLFATVSNMSVDHAVMEKSTNVAVVACDIGWNDVGSWNTIGELITPDAAGNRLIGDVYAHDSSDCLIQSSDRVVAVIGVKNLVIIDTPDALLVTDKASVQQVKNTVGQLKKNHHTTSKEHATIFRPWGFYTILEEAAGFKIKRIEVLPKCSLSLQKHEHRSEHWVVVSGVASVQNDELCFELFPSQSTYIQAGHKHRLKNSGDEVLVMIEVQCGKYLDEDDIIRFDDVYGRTTA